MILSFMEAYNRMPQPIYTKDDMKELQKVYEEAIKDREKAILKQTSAFGKVDDENLVKWQLELDNILERIDHLLRGHKLTTQDGNLVWTDPKDPKEAIFNEYGVNEILRILSLYLNRNTILSNFTEEQVELKVYDFGNEVADLILNKYEDMGLTTTDKMVMFPMIVRELIDIIHAAYLRGLKGGERESLREARSVLQSQPIGAQPMIQRPERGIMNPMRYIAGKYK